MARRFKGVTDEGVGPNALFRIGLRVGVAGRGLRRGQIIEADRAKWELLRMRAQQVGRRAATSTITHCEGQWEGTSEPVLACEIEFFPSRRERTDGTFRENVLKLAERVAACFGQREVQVRLDGRMLRANAPRRRGPKPLRPGGRVLR